MKFERIVLLPLFLAGALHATSHCYKQRTNCFVQEDGKADIKMYAKRDRFTKVAQKNGLSEKEINAMIKKGEGRLEENREREDLRDERGYYGGVYWSHPIYAYPPYYWDDDDHHHDHPHHPVEKPPSEKPSHGPITIQPTENPVFDRPRPGGPSTQPVQRPTTRPVTRPQRPAARPRPTPRPRPRPRPRPVRRAR